jgi:diketogulonate reductase-like aldo/keto reductase
MKHLEDELGALGWELDEEQMRKLNEASEPEMSYPWNFVEFAQGGRDH